jgi:hypothetical protein
MMTNRRYIIALGSILVVLGCNDSRDTTSPLVARATPRASLVVPDSFNLPIPFPTGLTYGPTLAPAPRFWLSTGFGTAGLRETHVIDRATRADVGDIPTGGNPRDLSYSYLSSGESLFFADVDSNVYQRDLSGALVNSFHIPWRGGAIAAFRDTLYIGDQDSPRMIVKNQAGLTVRTFIAGLRAEGMVYDSTSNTLWVVTLFDSYIYEMDVLGNVLRKCDSPYHPGPYGLGGIADVGDSLFIAQAQNEDPFEGTTIFVVSKQYLNCAASPPVPVSLSIKAAGDENRINLKSGGTLRVAILSSETFDAANVDISSLRFGHSGNEAAALDASMKNVNGNARRDLLVEFNLGGSGIACGDLSAVLSGKLSTGTEIRGADAIRVKCK